MKIIERHNKRLVTEARWSCWNCTSIIAIEEGDVKDENGDDIVILLEQGRFEGSIDLECPCCGMHNDLGRIDLEVLSGYIDLDKEAEP